MTTETATRWRPSEKKAGDTESMLCDDHPDAVLTEIHQFTMTRGTVNIWEDRER